MLSLGKTAFILNNRLIFLYLLSFWSSLLNDIKLITINLAIFLKNSWLQTSKWKGYTVIVGLTLLLGVGGWILWSLICWHYIVWLPIGKPPDYELIFVVVATSGLHSKNAPSCGHICKCTHKKLNAWCVHAEIFKSIKNDI